jgi:hypothetical protein
MQLRHSPKSVSRKPQCDAARATQWIYSPVSVTSLRKTGVLLSLAGDFWEFGVRKFDFVSLETIDNKKSPRLASLSHRKKKIL